LNQFEIQEGVLESVAGIPEILGCAVIVEELEVKLLTSEE
jgi:hypothetical protein